MIDYPHNPLPRKQMHPALQFVTLFLMVATLMVFGSVIGGGIAMAKYGVGVITDIQKLNTSGANVVSALWLIEFFGTTLPILITPIFFSYVMVREPDVYIKHNFHFPWLLIVIVLLAMVAAMPLIEFLSNLNAKMVLPKSLKAIEDWMKQSENEAEKLSNAMMQMNTLGDMIYNLLFIGLLTAIVEEILFRGCFQTIFLKWTKNMHAAIWITAILFSAFHMEFYGFLPRMLLGLLFGYFVAWSGSIWPAILAHFVNNGTIVIWEYLYQNKMTSINPETPQFFTNAGYIISFFITILILFIYWYISSKWHVAHHGEELD